MARPKGSHDTFFLSEGEEKAEKFVQKAIKGLRSWNDPHRNWLRVKGPSYNNVMHEHPSLMHMITVAEGLGKSVKEVYGIELGSGEYDKFSPEDFDKLVDVMNSAVSPTDRALVWLRAGGMGWINLRKKLQEGPVSEIKLRYKYSLRNIYLELLRMSA